MPEWKRLDCQSIILYQTREDQCGKVEAFIVTSANSARQATSVGYYCHIGMLASSVELESVFRI